MSESGGVQRKTRTPHLGIGEILRIYYKRSQKNEGTTKRASKELKKEPQKSLKRASKEPSTVGDGRRKSCTGWQKKDENVKERRRGRGGVTGKGRKGDASKEFFKKHQKKSL